MLHTLHWPEEIRDPGDLSSPAPTTDREQLHSAIPVMSPVHVVSAWALEDGAAETDSLTGVFLKPVAGT